MTQTNSTEDASYVDETADNSTYTDLDRRNYIIDVEKEYVRRQIRRAYSGGTVVDIGGGWGEVLSGIPPQDIDRAIIIDYAARRVTAGREALPSIEYIAGDGFALPLGDEVADVVVCSEVLQHISDAEKFVGEMGRILKPGGELVLSSLSENKLKTAFVKAHITLSGQPQYLLQADDPHDRDDLIGTFNLGFSAEDIRELFERADLEPDEITYTLFRELAVNFDFETAKWVSDSLNKPLLRSVFSGHFVASGVKPAE